MSVVVRTVAPAASPSASGQSHPGRPRRPSSSCARRNALAWPAVDGWGRGEAAARTRRTPRWSNMRVAAPPTT